MNDLQGRPHGALGVFFVRGGPAEIGQDAITHVAGDKPVVARDHIAAEGSIRVQQAPQFFGVELFTQRRRTHQVAEHHGKLAAFAAVRNRIFAERSRSARRCLLRRAQGRNRLEESFTVAQGHAKLTEVALRQLRQNFGVDFALTKHRFILTETEAAQPTADIHGRIPTGSGR